MLCPGWILRAIEVEVVDGTTGLPVASGAVGIARDGDYSEPLRVVGWRADTATTLGAAEGRRGTYDVRVERAGFAPWERRGIPARVGRCGVETTTLRAELTR